MFLISGGVGALLLPLILSLFWWSKAPSSLWDLQFASRISGMRFCEASAKDNFNVDEIFLKLVDDILSKVGAVHFICKKKS